MLSIYYSLRKAVIGNTLEVLKYAVPIMLVILLVKYFFGKEKKIYLKKSLYEFLLVGYVITVLLLTDILHIGLDDFMSMHIQPNLIPFMEVISDIQEYPRGALEQVILNMVFFVPLGILLFLCFSKMNMNKVFITAVSFSSALEIAEYFAGRYADINDLFWNVAGAMGGALVYKVVEMLCSNVLFSKAKTS